MREHWSKLGFILASIGSAIGLGNIWRFPYIVGENGGGAFLIAYIVAIIIFGFPLMIMEFSIGEKFKGSVVTSLKKIHPKIKYLGFFAVFVCLGILSYYLVIAGWTLAYSVFSIFTQIDFTDFTNTLYPLAMFFITLLIITFIVRTGIKKGIERVCNVLLPTLFILVILLVIKAVTLPNAIEGIRFYLTPDISSLVNPRIWLMAIAQALFSLSLGTGILITYGSYLKKTNIPKSSLIVIISDTLIAVLAGFIIFPIVFSFGINPATGPQLAFVTLPKIFSFMAFGHFFETIFFLLLFIGALTSAISMMEVGTTTLIDEFKLNRKKATLIILGIIFIAGLPSALSYSSFNFTVFGKTFLDMMDHLFGDILLPICALIMTTGIMWFIKPKALLEEINKGSKIKIPYFIIPVLKYLIPVLLLVIVLMELF